MPGACSQYLALANLEIKGLLILIMRTSLVLYLRVPKYLLKINNLVLKYLSEDVFKLRPVFKLKFWSRIKYAQFKKRLN